MSKNIKIAIVAVLAAVAAYFLYRRFATPRASEVVAVMPTMPTATPTKGNVRSVAGVNRTMQRHASIYMAQVAAMTPEQKQAAIDDYNLNESNRAGGWR